MNETIKESIKLFKKGLSIKEVSEITGRKYKTEEGVARRFKQEIGEITKYQKYKVNHDFFDNIDSEIKAYLLGYLIADGSIEKRSSIKSGFRISFCSSTNDRYVIDLINKYICPSQKITYLKNNRGAVNRKEQCSFRFCSEHMYNTLINKYQIHTNKTYDENFVFPFDKIDDNMQMHLIRGFFDGDGNVDFAKILTINGKETCRFQYGLIATSERFLNQIGSIMCNNINGLVPTIKKTKGKTVDWFVMRFNSFRIDNVNKRYIHYKKLYENANFYLKRKKSKFDDFFKHRGKPVI